MAFRVPPHRQLEIGRYYASQQSSRSAKLQHQIASGLRIHRPSDDPRGQKIVLDQQAVAIRFDAQQRSIDEARNILNAAHVQVRDAQNLIVQVKDLALQARQITDPNEPRIFANEIDAILTTLNGIANARHEGRFLFAGADVYTQPYDDVSQSTTFHGALEEGSIPLAGEARIRTFYSGQHVFRTGAGGTTVIRGSTGATGGLGTASAAAHATLSVRHSLTTYSAASGVQPGASSVGGDTIIGEQGTHHLTIVDSSGNGTSGTVSLNGGAPIPFTNQDLDLQTTGPDGEVVFLNMQTVTPGFSGSVDITADGTISADGGATSVPITFSADQTLTTTNGSVWHVDTREITHTGEDSMELGENADIFETLRLLRDDLRRYDDFSSPDWDELVGRRIGQLDLANEHLLDVVGEQSVDLQSLDRLHDRAADLKLEAERVLSQVQATDIVDTTLQLQEEQNLNRFALATLTQVFDVSILDFLR